MSLLLLPTLYLCVCINLWFLISVLQALTRIIDAGRMLNKAIKKCPSRSAKQNHRRCRGDHHIRLRKLSTVPMFARINKCISTCRRNLVRFFSNLSGRKGLKALGQESTRQHAIKFEIESDVAYLHRHLLRDRKCPLLPPIKPGRSRTLFLDLDETLVHSCPDPPPNQYDFIIRPKISGKPMNFYVLKRPGVDKFLEEMSKKFEVVVFTAGVRSYAKLVVDHLDPKGVLISHRLYRDSCRRKQRRFAKDLSRTGRDLGTVVLLDDNANAYSLQPENGVPIDQFVGDVRDRELERLMEFFQTCDLCEDMRDAANAYFHRRCGDDLDDDQHNLSEPKIVVDLE